MLYKLASNCLFGKFQQKSSNTKSVFVSSQRELENVVLENEPNIENVYCINDSMCRVIIKQAENRSLPKRDINCYIGSQLVSLAREELYKHILTLEKVNAKIYYYDVDSIFFSINAEQNIPLSISHALGHFKNVYKEEILSFFCLGPKNYALCLKSGDKIKEVIKLRGLSLTSFCLKNAVNADLYELFLNACLSNVYASKKIKQNAKKFKTFSNNITIKRKVLCKKKLTTVPFGYCK